MRLGKSDESPSYKVDRLVQAGLCCFLAFAAVPLGVEAGVLAGEESASQKVQLSEEAPAASCFDDHPVLLPISEDLTSNRGDQLPYGRAQLVALVEGGGPAILSIEFESIDGSGENYLIEFDLDPGAETIVTAEYDVYGLAPTGRYRVEGAQASRLPGGLSGGTIHGIAFGGVWRDEAGYFRTVQSFDKKPSQSASFVGAWPFEIPAEKFERMTPQISRPEGRDMARAMLFGAKVIDNGCYRLRRHVR